MLILTGVTSGASFQPESRAYFDRCEIPPGFVTAVRLDAFIRGMKQAGIWSALPIVYEVAVETRQAAKLNLKGPSFPLIDFNSPPWAPFQGFQGDGVAAYLNVTSNYNSIPGHTLGNGSMFAGAITDVSRASWIMGATGGGNASAVRMRNGQSAAVQAQSASGATDAFPCSTGAGLAGWSRGDLNGFTADKDGTDTAFARAAGSALATGPLNILRFGSGSNFALDQFSDGFVGGFLSPAQVQSLVQLRRTYLIAVGAISGDDPPPPPPAFPAPFAPNAAITPPGMLVFRECAPPPSDSATVNDYQFGPLNRVFTNNIAAVLTSTSSLVKAYHMIWVDRVRGLTGNIWRKPNPIVPVITTLVNGVSTLCRTEFTTQALAELSTRCKGLFSGGADATNADGTGYLDIAAAAGLTVITWAQAAADAASATPVYFAQQAAGGLPFRVCVDVCVLPQGRITDAAIKEGIGYDIEPQDGRDPDSLANLIETLAADAHGFGLKVATFNNALNGGGGQRSGFDVTSGWRIHAAVDYLGLMFWSQSPEHDPAASIANQRRILMGPDGDKPIDNSRLVIIFECGHPGTTEADARTARAIVTDPAAPYAGVHIWLDYADLPADIADPTQRKIGILTGQIN